MVRDGNLQQGRDRIAALKGAAPRTYLLTYWQLAAFFENQPDYVEAFAVLVADLEQALTDVRGSGDEEDQRAAAELGRLLRDAKTHDWAALTVPPESLLLSLIHISEPTRPY